MESDYWLDENAETAVLSGILMAGSLGKEPGLKTLRQALGAGLFPEDFYYESNGRIYISMCLLANEGRPVDPISVADKIRERYGADKFVYGKLVGIMRENHSMTLVADHAAIVVKWSKRRKDEHGS